MTQEFSTKQLKLIFNAIRYYQMNRVPLNSQLYHDCDDVLNQIFPVTVPEVSTGSSEPTSDSVESKSP